MSRIWVPKFKIIEPKAAIPVRATVAGRYKCRIRKRDGVTVRHETPWFDNLILNNGLDLIGRDDASHSVCVVGNGNSDPAVGQTSLDSLVATKSGNPDSTSESNSGSSPWTMEKTFVYEFGQGDAQGNLSEIGVGNTATDLFSRALIVDGNGDPTTLTIQSDEFLDVTYKNIVEIPETDVTGTIDISGTSHDYTARVSDASDWGLSSISSILLDLRGFSNVLQTQVYDGAIGGIDAEPAGSSTSAESNGASAYSNDDYFRDHSATFGLSDGNFATGIQSAQANFGFTHQCPFQFEYDPVIDKGDTEVLTLNWRFSWDRVPES